MPRPTGGWTPNGLCSLFVCDIASFGHPSRTDLDRHRVRAALYEGLRRSFDEDGVPYEGCYSEDRGDGAMVVVPPSVDTTTLLTSLLDRLKAEVRRHNDVSSAAAQMQLRLAVHVGHVHSDGRGLVGTAVNETFRILEAEQLKQILRRTGADVALITSDRVYEDVIRHGLGLVNAREYHRVEVRVKETAKDAWIRVPGMFTPITPVVIAPAPPAPLTITDARAIEPATPTTPDPSQPIAGVTVTDHAPGLEAVVDKALKVRELHSRRLRDQVIAELPLALAMAIRPQRVMDDRADMTAIVRVCDEHPRGLHDLLRVVRQFGSGSAQLDELTRSVNALGRA